jgi:hypothetical protein
MAVILSPVGITSFSSVWQPGLPYEETTESEGDVLVLSYSANNSTAPFNSTYSDFSVVPLTAAAYASYNSSTGVIDITQLGVYEITVNSSYQISDNALESINIINRLNFEVDTGDSIVSPEAAIHSLPQNNVDGHTLSQVNITDQFIVIVETLPAAFYPSVANYTYSPPGTFNAQMRVVVRRSGDYLIPV